MSFPLRPLSDTDISVSMVGKDLVIRCPIKPVRSAKGKSTVVASTKGHRVSEIMIGGKSVVIYLAAYCRDKKP